MLPWRRGIVIVVAIAIVAVIEGATRGVREFSSHRWRLLEWLFIVVLAALLLFFGVKTDE